jgi:hypothetical protein
MRSVPAPSGKLLAEVHAPPDRRQSVTVARKLAWLIAMVSVARGICWTVIIGVAGTLIVASLLR